MQAYDLEKKFFHIALNVPDYLTYTKSQFFDNSDISETFKYAKALKLKYPDIVLDVDKIYHLVKSKNRHDILTRDKLEIIFNYDKSILKDDYLQRGIESWLQVKNLESGMISGQMHFRSQEITIENAAMVCADTLNIINSNGYLSFHQSEGVDFLNPETHQYDEDGNRKKTGIEYIDTVLNGGISPGEVGVLIGETNVGKSIWLCNLAKWYMEQGYNVGYITLEMGREKVVKRIGSNAFEIPIGDYYDTMNDPETSKNVVAQYKQRRAFSGKVGQLIIEKFPTSQLSVPQLENFLLDKIEKRRKIKLDIIIIDYIQIMNNWRNPNTDSTFMKIKQLAEDLRGMSSKNDWAVWTVSQIKQGAYGTSDIVLNDTSESSGLGVTVDVVFGIMQDNLLKANRKYRLKLLKNRDGSYKDTSHKFNIDYNYMKIIQDPTSTIEGYVNVDS